MNIYEILNEILEDAIKEVVPSPAEAQAVKLGSEFAAVACDVDRELMINMMCATISTYCEFNKKENPVQLAYDIYMQVAKVEYEGGKL